MARCGISQALTPTTHSTHDPSSIVPIYAQHRLLDEVSSLNSARSVANGLRAGPIGFCGDGVVCIRLLSTVQALDIQRDRLVLPRWISSTYYVYDGKITAIRQNGHH